MQEENGINSSFGRFDHVGVVVKDLDKAIKIGTHPVFFCISRMARTNKGWVSRLNKIKGMCPYFTILLFYYFNLCRDPACDP